MTSLTVAVCFGREVLAHAIQVLWMFEVGAAAGHHGGGQFTVSPRLHTHDGLMLTSVVNPQLHTIVTEGGLSEVRMAAMTHGNTSLNALENRRR